MQKFGLFFMGGIGAFLVVQLAPVALNLLAIKFPNTFFNIPLESISARSDVSETCNIGFEHIRTVTNVHSFKQALEIINEDGHQNTILFKGFLHNSAAKWKELERDHADAVLSFTNLNFTNYGSMWTAGVKSANKVEMKLGDFFNQPVDKNATSAPYASFLAFLKPKTIRDDNNEALEDHLEIRADTNFVSNFPRDVLATPIHAAPTGHSFAFQMVGKKLWLLMSPEEMEKYSPICTPATLLTKGSEREFFASKPSTLIAVQEEGDLLFFPVHWGHAVLTKEGPNVMLVLREKALLAGFLRQPRRLIEGLLSLIVTSANVRIFSHKHVNPVQQQLTMKGDAKSACASQWSEWMRSNPF